MDENNHGIFLAWLDFRRRQKPALNIEAFIHPLKAFGFTPRS